jgi:hypothetical protein
MSLATAFMKVLKPILLPPSPPRSAVSDFQPVWGSACCRAALPNPRLGPGRCPTCDKRLTYDDRVLLS